MPFWSSQTLEEKLPALIDPYDDSKVEQASYTLGIGREIYITKDHQNSNSQHTKRTLKVNQAFVIPPGQFAFLLTEETVKVPSNAIAFISMKAGIKYKGLVNISGFHVDPGFEGKLLFSVYNAGPSPIHLSREQPCFLIWYASLDQTDSKPRNGLGYTSIPTDVLNKISTDQIYSLQALTSEFKKIDGKYDSVSRWILAIKWIAGFLGAAIISGSGIVYSHWDKIINYYSAFNKLVEEQHAQPDSIVQFNTTESVCSITSNNQNNRKSAAPVKRQKKNC